MSDRLIAALHDPVLRVSAQGSVFLFPPVFMTLAAVGLARAMIWLDQSGALVGSSSESLLYAQGPAAATTLLSVIAAALVGSLTTFFSVSLASLTFASSQFGPRLLDLFLRDRRTHVAIGLLASTFAYSLVILRAIGNVDEPPFVPRFTVTVAMLLVASSVAVILYFGYYLSEFIQAPGLIAAVSRELRRSSAHLYPSRMGLEPGDRLARPLPADVPLVFNSDATVIVFAGRGYIQRVDEKQLMRLAIGRDIVVRLVCRPGDYVLPGHSLALVWPAEHIDERLSSALNAQFTLGWRRTSFQDIEFPFCQLVEIAVRALSPGINDPFTAMQCIDRLADALVAFVDLKFPSAHRYDGQGCLRVVVGEPPSFSSLTSTSFDPIRQYGRSSMLVCLHLLDALAALARRVSSAGDRMALRREVLLIDEGRSTLPTEADRASVHQRARCALALLGDGSGI